MADTNMIQENFWRNGPKPGVGYDFTAFYSENSGGLSGRQRTQYPSVTGSSVIGVKFNGGVVIAADKLGSYGSLARYMDLSRVIKVNDTTVLGGGGDYADFQHLQTVIEQHEMDEESLDDSFCYTPRSLFSWLTRVLYVRRTKLDPLWTTLVVAGLEDGEPFLGYIDKLGVSYESTTVASGFGLHLAQPILREVVSSSPSLSKEQAIQAVTRCMTVLFYRDARAINKYDLAVVTKDGVEIIGPLKSNCNWELAKLITENT